MKLLYLFTISLLCINLAATAQPTHTLKLNAAQGADAVIISSPNTLKANEENFGGEEHIAAFSYQEDDYDEEFWYTRTLINFDWSTIPQNVRILEARLNLYSDPELGDFDDLISEDYNTNELFLKRIIKPWEEMEVTWSTQPATSEDNIQNVESDYSNVSDLLGLDVTDLVQDILEDPENSHGIMMQLAQENDKRARILASSDHSDESLHPQLEVTYTKDSNNGGSIVLGDHKIRYWPNPVITKLNITAADFGAVDQSVRIFDLLGNLKYQGDFDHINTLSIDASDWNQGVYLMQVNSDNLKKSVRIYKR